MTIKINASAKIDTVSLLFPGVGVWSLVLLWGANHIIFANVMMKNIAGLFCVVCFLRNLNFW